MRAYVELAILDHNYNTQRQQATTKSGLFITIPCKIVLHVFISSQGKPGSSCYSQKEGRHG